MNRTRRTLAIALALAAFFFAGRPARAASASVNIHVSINATKSLSALTTTYSFGALPINVSSVSASAIVIRNDSGALVETYTIQGGNAISDSGGTNWTLAAATTTNTFALGAQFSAAAPANADASWDSTDYLTTSAQACSATQFGNGVAAESGQGVLPLAGSYDRNLWFRFHTPNIVTDPGSHTVSITIAVQ